MFYSIPDICVLMYGIHIIVFLYGIIIYYMKRKTEYAFFKSEMDYLILECKLFMLTPID
jgi:uncharacterized protein YqgQ